MSDRTARCPACGKPTSPGAENCAACDEPLHRLCECGGRVSVFANACPACGKGRRTALPRRRRGRRILVGLLVLALAGGGILAARKLFSDPGARRAEAAELAAREIRRGDYSSARVRLRAAVRSEGETDRLLYLLAVAEHGLGHRGAAEKFARRVLASDPGDEEAGLLLESLLLDRGEAGEALRRARAAVEAGSKRAGHHETIARALLITGEGEPEEVERELRTAAALEPEPGPAARRLGEWTLARAAALPGVAPDAEDRAAIRTARTMAARDLGPDADLEAWSRVARMDLATRDATDLDRLLEPVREKRADPAYRLLLARIAERGGRPGRARVLVEGLLHDEDPGPGILLGLRDLLRERGDAARAEEVLTRTRRQYPDDPSVALATAEAALAGGDAAGAERTLRAALDRDPANVDLAVFLAGRLAESGRGVEAEALLRRAADAPDGALARLRLAGLLLDRAGTSENERLDRAAALVDSARADARRDPVLALHLRRIEGRIALARGDAAQAVERLGALAPDAPSDAGLHVLLARARRALGEPALAAAELTSAMRIGGRSVPLLLARGDAWLAAGRADPAGRDARAALEAEPENAAALLLHARARAAGDRPLAALEILDRLPDGTPGADAVRGRALLRAGKTARARDRLEAALRDAGSEAERFEAGFLLATAEDEAEQEGSARRRAFLEEFVARHPDHARARAARVRLLARDGDLSAARAAARVALSAAPDDAELLEVGLEVNLLANEAAPSDVAAAAALAKRLEASAPGSWRGPYAAGRLALVRGEDPAAVDALRRAAEIAPETPKVLAWLGLALHRTGENDEAATALAAALRIEPDYPFPNRLLARVMLGQAGERLDAADPEAALRLLAGAGRHDADDAGLLTGIRRAAREAARTGNRALLGRAREECRKLLEETGSADAAARARILRAIADLSAALGDADGALAAAREHASLAPEDPPARARLAVALASAGRTDEALGELDAATREIGERPELLAARWAVLTRADRKEEAAAAALAWTKLAPDSATARLAHARALGGLGRAGDAEPELRRALEIAPDLLPAARLLSARLAATGRAGEAADLFERLAAEAGDAARASLRLLAADMRLAAKQDAEAAFRELADDAQAPNGIRLAAERCLLEILLGTSRDAEAADRAAPLLALVRRDAAAAPEAPLAARAGSALVAAGLAAQRSGSPSFAAELYREALARTPDDVTATNNLAEILAGDTRTAKEAVALAQGVVDRSPGVPEFRDTLGHALLSAGDPVGAAKAYRAAAEGYRTRGEGEDASRTPESDAVNRSRSLLGLARALLAVGDRDGANAALDEAEAANPAVREDPAFEAARKRR